MANFELYKIFVQVAMEQNITKASERLNISQPAVTKHIQNLENELNTNLFIRTKGMQLTPKGKQLYEVVSPAVKSILEIEKKLNNNKNMNFGTYATMLSKVLSNCIAEFYQKNRNIKINTITEPFDSLLSKLKNYELDIAVLKKVSEKIYDSAQIKYIKLGYTDFVLIANNLSNLCNKKVSIKDIKNKVIYIPRGETESTIQFSEMLKKNSIEQVKKIDSVTMLRIIEEYDCVGFVNKQYIKDKILENKITVLDIDFEIPSTEYGIYIHRNNTAKEIADFIKILKNNFDYNSKL